VHLLLPRYASPREDSSRPALNCWGYGNDGGADFGGDLQGGNHANPVRFYRDVLGLELACGGEDVCFSSFRAKGVEYPILNLEQGHSVTGWGRMIFYVADGDAFWEYLRGKGFDPESPRDASWGERYFHMPDPDDH
jgi:hypothetical protein